MTEGPKLPSVSEAGVLAAITACAYAIAFVYEAAIADSFGIPRELIDIRLSTVFVALTGLLFTFWLMHSYLLASLPDRDSPVFYYFRWPIWLAIGLLPSTVILSIYTPSRTMVLFVYGGLIVLASPKLLNVFLHPGATFTDRVRAAQDADDRHGWTKFDRFVDSLGEFRPWVVGAVIVLFYSWVFGRFQTLSDSTYWIKQESNAEYVLLHVYGDKAVTAKLDRTNKKILPEYRVIPLVDVAGSFRQERIGQLGLPSPATNPPPPPPPPKAIPAREPVKAITPVPVLTPAPARPQPDQDVPSQPAQPSKQLTPNSDSKSNP